MMQVTYSLQYLGCKVSAKMMSSIRAGYREKRKAYRDKQRR